MNQILVLIPILIYLSTTIFIVFLINKKNKNKDFIEEYFIGSRSMGGFILAMTVTATYTGASSFISGPGVAYKMGLSWVLLACIQTPTIFLTLGILGKRLAIISRRIGSITIMDFLRARYENNFVVLSSSLMMLSLFAAIIVTQFIAGARIFESITNIPYFWGLVIFASVVIGYTSLGGFRAVAITDAIQMLVMLLSTMILFVVLVVKSGGMTRMMETIARQNPALLTVDSGGTNLPAFVLSFWFLVGIGVMGQPAVVVRCMGFKDSRSIHHAIIIGTIMVGVLMLCMHLTGVLGAALLPNLSVGDKIIPTLAVYSLPPILLGVFIGGPIAAIMSTVDSLLILSSATIIKDIYIYYINPNPDPKKIKLIVFIVSLFLGFTAFLLALNPPKLIVWINLFSLAVQEAVFFCPIVLGLYWKKANAAGVIASMLVGIALYMTINIFKISIFGIHPIIPTMILTISAFIIGSLFGRPSSEKALDTFFNL